MKRAVVVLALTLVVGIATGIIGTRMLSAQQPEIKRTELLRTALPDVAGKEAVVFTAEIPPGVVTGKHRHPGSELIYVLEGSYVLEVEGKGPLPLKAGDARYAPPGEIHAAKSVGSTQPSKVLVFLIAEKGQPLAIPVQ
jgi:quercetin dioxygenase-like cupin family protein